MKRWFILLLPVLLLCGCAGRGTLRTEQARYTMGVLLKAMGHQHWMDVRAGVMDAARELNVEIILLYPQSESAAEEQTEMFHDLIAAQPDAILFAPCDSSSCAPLAEEAAEAGIALLTLDTRAEDVALPYVGADNFLVGQLAAEQLAAVMGEQGETAVIAGVAQQSAHRERLAGFEEALRAYPAMKLVAVAHADSDFTLAMERTEEIFRTHPDVGGFFCTSAVMALGNVEQQRNGFYATSPAVVAVDTQDDALNALQTGRLVGLVSQDGYEAGYEAVGQAVRLLSGEEMQENFYIATTMLTRDTVDGFIRERLRGTEGSGYAAEGVTGR